MTIIEFSAENYEQLQSKMNYLPYFLSTMDVNRENSLPIEAYTLFQRKITHLPGSVKLSHQVKCYFMK